MTNLPKWIDNPTVSGVAPCNTDILNDDLMYLKNRLDNQITNCILEAPYRINVELKDGVLTLKKGSVVIVPNGAGKFEERTITSDISYPSLTHATCNRMVFLNNQTNMLIGHADTICFSGASQPETTSTAYLWYDTTNNVVKTYNNGSWSTGLSLPICIGNYVNGSGFSSIDQVFNGMGYIGSTVWVDKGVKGLIPNGRNADGTLNNIEWITDKIYKRDMNWDSTNFCVALTPTASYQIHYFTKYFESDVQPTNATSGNMWLNTLENRQYRYIDGVWQDLSSYTDNLFFAYITTNANKQITSFQPKLPFRAVDYNDFQQLSDDKVNRAGDTMTGNLIIEKAQGQGSFAIREPSLDFTTSPAANATPSFRCIDKNSSILGDVRFERRTDGSQRTTMLARNKRNGTQVDASITVAVGATGVRSCAINGQSLGAFVVASTKTATTRTKTWSDGLYEEWGYVSYDNWGDGTIAFTKTFKTSSAITITTDFEVSQICEAKKRYYTVDSSNNITGFYWNANISKVTKVCYYISGEIV